MNKKPPRQPDRHNAAPPASGSRWPARPRIGANNPGSGARERVNHDAYKPVERQENSVWPDPQTFLAGARPPRPPSAAREPRRSEPAPPPKRPSSERKLLSREPASERYASGHTPLGERVGHAGTQKDESERSVPAQRRGEEMRVYGRNACLAVFARRPQDVRKVYLTEARLPEFKNVLAWCVKHRLGYRVVETDDLDRLTDAQHHEGICFEVRRVAALGLSALLQEIPADQPALLIWLDGVGNPHNVGAMLRSAANFGVRGVIMPGDAPSLSGAAMRVAEGGAEAVPVAQARRDEDVFAALRLARFRIAATAPRAGDTLYTSVLPSRLAVILGAEGEGMSADLLARADLRLTIPGSGAVESLNVSASAAVLFAEYWRQHHSSQS